MDSENEFIDKINRIECNSDTYQLSYNGPIPIYSKTTCGHEKADANLMGVEKSGTKLRQKNCNPKNHKASATFWTNEKDLQQFDVFSASCEPYSMTINADSENNSKDNHTVMIYFPEICYNHGQVEDIKYIDDLAKEELVLHPSQQHELSCNHEFVVYENLFTDQLNNSISRSSHWSDSHEVGHENYLVFSTSNSKLSNARGRSENTCNHDIREEQNLSWNVSPIKSKRLLDSNLKHSTPRKLKNPNLSFEVDFDSESEDDDIEESYLETVWLCGGSSSLNSCSLLVKSFVQPQENVLSQTMICKMEDVDESIFLRFQDVEDVFHKAKSNLEGKIDGKYSLDESFPLIGPPPSSSFSDKVMSSFKVSYKDKLMEGLPVHTTTDKLVTLPSPAGEINMLPDVNDKISRIHDHLTGRDHNFNIMTTEVRKSAVINQAHKTLDGSKVINGLRNGQKIKKNAFRQVNNCSDPPFRDHSESSLRSNNKFNKVQTKSEKTQKDHLSDVDLFSNRSLILDSSKNKKNQTITFNSSKVEEGKSAGEKPQPMRRKSRKLKKFCSLDLSKSQDGFDGKLCQNKKWKSNEDLDDGLQPSPIKSDNYLLWPLVGLAVIAGFVAFCFRDKISFMIASKFPFERPPI